MGVEGYTQRGRLSRCLYWASRSLLHTLNPSLPTDQPTIKEYFKFRLIVKYQPFANKAPKPQIQILQEILGDTPSFFLRKYNRKTFTLHPIWSYSTVFSCHFIVIGVRYLSYYSTAWSSPEQISEFVSATHGKLVEYQRNLLLRK